MQKNTPTHSLSKTCRCFTMRWTGSAKGWLKPYTSTTLDQISTETEVDKISCPSIGRSSTSIHMTTASPPGHVTIITTHQTAEEERRMAFESFNNFFRKLCVKFNFYYDIMQSFKRNIVILFYLGSFNFVSK